MTEKYQIDLRHQFKSISNGLWNIGMIPVALAVLWFWKGIYPDAELIIALILWTLFWFIPALILHPTYYFLNKSTVIEIDRQKEKLHIVEKGKLLEIDWSDLKEIERIFYSDYRHAEWKQNYIPMPWRNYGLIRIQTLDNQEFFFTSLMIDIVNPPIQPTKNSYKYVPFPPKSLQKQQNEAKQKKNAEKDRIDHFKKKFIGLSESELQKKSNAKELVYEARTAAKELMNEKNTAANKTSHVKQSHQP